MAATVCVVAPQRGKQSGMDSLWQTVKVGKDVEVTFVVDAKLDDPIAKYIITSGQYPRQQSSELMLSLLRPGQVFLDIGAHIGTYALAAAAAGCSVAAIEPYSRSARWLRAAAEHNGCDQMPILQAVASESAGTCEFVLCGPWSHVCKPRQSADRRTIRMRTVAVDDWLDEIGWKHVDLVKMHISGYECHAIRGMRRLLGRRDGPMLLFESNAPALEWYDEKPARLLAQLERLGYRNYLIDHLTPGRLVPVRAKDVQPEAIAHYLAAKRLPRYLLRDWQVRSLKQEELVARLAATCRHSEVSYRKYPAWVLRKAPRWLKHNPEIKRAIQGLVRDSHADVKKAASWADPAAQPGADARPIDLSRRASRTVTIRDEIKATFVFDAELDDPIARWMVDTDHYPTQASNELMLDMLRPGHTMLDIGAHLGTYGLAAAALGCRVAAVDGNPANVAWLRESVAENSFDRMSVVHAVVSDRPGWVRFSPHFAWGFVSKWGRNGGYPAIKVRAVSVDGLVDELGLEHVDFIKLDIEGYELHAIRGMKRLLSRPDGPAIMFESNAIALEKYGHTPGRLLQLLEELGYKNYMIDYFQSGRLIPTQAGDDQPDAVADYLAVKELPDSLSARWTAKPFSQDELTRRTAAVCTSDHPPYRQYAARSLRNAPVWLLSREETQSCLEKLRTDKNRKVRKAAAWSARTWQPAWVQELVRKARAKGFIRKRSNLGAASSRPARTSRSLDRTAVLSQWKECALKYKTLPEGRQLIEPYILCKKHNGIPIDFLIATQTGRNWYDHLGAWRDIDLASQLELIRPGDVIFDIGAHHGFYSAIYSKMTGAAGRVYAFEPFPLNADVLRHNILLNAANTEVFELGISNEKKEIDVSATGESVADCQAEDSVTISLDVLDNYAHLKPNFLKIDIEGAEVDALAGAQKVLEQKPNIEIEIHTQYLPQFGRTVDELFDLLSMKDYLCYIDYPGKPIGLYEREFEIREPCALFLARTDAVKRIYLGSQ